MIDSKSLEELKDIVHGSEASWEETRLFNQKFAEIFGETAQETIERVREALKYHASILKQCLETSDAVDLSGMPGIRKVDLVQRMFDDLNKIIGEK